LNETMSGSSSCSTMDTPSARMLAISSRSKSGSEAEKPKWRKAAPPVENVAWVQREVEVVGVANDHRAVRVSARAVAGSKPR
jgi:hypothetical protein